MRITTVNATDRLNITIHSKTKRVLMAVGAATSNNKKVVTVPPINFIKKEKEK
jgi:hypothetical protein